jgi:hypothetical protein
MNRAITSFDKYSILENKKGPTGRKGLKGLVQKDDDEELTLNDAKKIGRKVANMEGEEKKKYVGIINFLGASCNIYNELWKNYKRTRDSKED